MSEIDHLMEELIQLRKKIVDLERNDSLFKDTEKELQAANKQLLASRKQLELKQETLMQTQRIARVGSWEWDVASDTVIWSDELFQIFRLNPENGAVSYADHPKIYTPESMQLLDTAVRQALESGESYKMDLEILRGDGTNAFCSAQAYAKKDEKGKVIRLYGSLQDITERKKAEEELKKSEERLKTIIDNSPFPIAVVDEKDHHIQYWSKSAIQLFGHNPKTSVEWYELAYPNPIYRQQVIDRWKPLLEKAKNEAQAVNAGEHEIHCKDGSMKTCEIYAQFIPGALIVTLNDITERKETEEQLKKIEWLLQSKKEKAEVRIPDYGDLTAINRNRTILDSVGKEVLNEMVSDYLSLLETSAAIYEKNGDYAVGIFSSDWCRFMDCSSRALCTSKDNVKALESGKWLCHESCWEDASKQSMQTNNAVDIECSGGIRIYAIPIRANNEVIGSINFGYGNPPTNEDKLAKIAANYQVSVDRLRDLAQSYETRPAFIIDIAKEKLATSAKLIGNIVERTQMEEELRLNQNRYQKAQEIGHVGNWEYDPLSTNFWASDEAKRIYGYDLNMSDFTTEIVENCIPERERVHQALIDLLEHNKKYDLVFDILTYDKGIRKTIHSMAEVERDVNGNPSIVTGVIIDISIQKRAEDHLNALNQQLLANEQQLRAANQQLQASEQQLKAANQQLMATNQQLQANEQQLRSSNESLFSSERKFRSLFNSMQEGVYLHRLVYDDLGNACDYQIIEANPISEEYLNIKRENAIGKLATELYGTEKAPYLEVYAKVAETGEAVSFEQYFEPMNKYFFTSVFSPAKGEFASVFLDITERKLTEISLKRANIELNKVQEISHVGSFTINLATNEVAWSEELYKIYGFDAALPPPPLNDSQSLFTPDSWELLSNSIAHTAETGLPYEIELNTLLQDGAIGWMWAWGEAMKDADGTVRGIWGVVQDISKRKQAEKEFKETEERYRELVNTINSGVAIYKVIHDGKSGSDYIIQEFNEFALNHEQLEKKDVIGKSLKDIRPNIDEFGLIDIFQKVWKTGESAFFPAKVYVDDNFSNYYENRVFRLSSGEIVAIYDDVSERENAVAQIKISQERFDLAMKASNDGLFDWNLISNEIYYSPRWKSMLGYQDEELPNDFTIWEKLTEQKDVERSWKMQQELINKQRDRFEMEFKMKHKKGHWVDILARAEAVFNSEGDATRIVGTHIDISARKKAELELIAAKEKAEENEEKIRQIFENSTIVHYSHDLDNVINYVSPEVENVLGYTPEEIKIKWTSLATNNPLNEIAYRNTAKAIETGEKQEPYQLEFIHKNGKRVLVEAHEAPVVKDGKTVSIVGSFADITNRKKTEIKLAEAKQKAEESDRLKSAFLANMSHEIRTPMNGILGFSRLLKEPQLTGQEQQKYIGIIEKSGTRMLNIINDIIDISKIEAGLMRLDMAESDINEQIEYIYTFFMPEVEAKGMKFSFKNALPAKEAIIKTDREKIFAILTNLVKNAIKYSNEGTIEFGYDKKGNFLEFFVKDSGIGIPKDRQSAIFERFIQGDIEDKMARQGAGLGLAITKAYVEMLGGHIWLVSEEGSGSTFYFTIPYDTVSEKTSGANINDLSDDFPTFDMKVLIVEDDETSSELLSIILDKYAKDIITVNNGTQALETFRNNQDIGLILLDIQIPNMNGLEVARNIRAFNKDVIIIAQTAYGLAGDREKAIDAGCTDYISKPINRDKLESLIKKHIGK